MTKRYFYTDPLAAAWQAKHHGMRFHLQYSEEEKSAFDVTEDFYDWLDADMGQPNTLGEVLERFKDFRRIYLHPDSLHLLEPKIDDAVEFDRWFWERQRQTETRDYPYQAHYGRVMKYGRNDECLGISSVGIGWDDTTESGKFSLPFKIIQRNGIPFMWPES